MLRRLVSVIAALGFALLLAVPVSASSPTDLAACRALLYLRSDQASNGAVALSSSNLASQPGVTEDYIFGGAAAGYDPNTFRNGSGASAYDYLVSALAIESNSASGTAKLALAAITGRRSATSFAGMDLISHLQSFHDRSGQPKGTYFDQTDAGSGFPTDAYTESLALMALATAGQPIPNDVVKYVKSHQDADGSWDFFLSKNDPSNPGDTNSTAMVLMGLKAAGRLDAVTLTRALAWLKTQQGSDGGFPYTKGSPTDPDSDAIVIQGLVAAAQDPQGTAWTVGGRNAVTSVLSFQVASGAFYYAFPGESSSEAVANEPFTTGQVPAALKFQPLPVAVQYSSGAALPASCSGSSASVGTTKSAPAGLPPTSGPPPSAPVGAVLLAAIGLALLLLALGIRRRLQAGDN